MFYPSIALLASAGAASALTITSLSKDPAPSTPALSAPACENFANITTLLQDDDGETYCSSVLSLGTVTNTLIEATTSHSTTTVTTFTTLTTTDTTTQTDTIYSGTITTTAPTVELTTTATITTTTYACPGGNLRRDLSGQLVAYGAGKTTSSPAPTSAAESDDECEEVDDLETFPGQYDNYSPAYITVYPPSAPQGKVLTLSSYLDRSSAPSNVPYAYPSGPAISPYSYQSAPFNSPYSYPTDTPAPYVSGNITIHHTGAATGAVTGSSIPLSTGSSKIPQPIVSSNSTVLPTGSISASSVILTTAPIVTPTPAPKPSCDVAPTAVRTGFACATIDAACDCLGLAPTTELVTSTATFTQVTWTTTTMTMTTGTQLTETETTTIPAATETLTPSTTITATATATATSCPCSGSTSTLCGATPDTCKDLQADNNNCGACGTTCGSGMECKAGKCTMPPAPIPNNPACRPSTCQKYVYCGSGCICGATAEGGGLCVPGTTSCSSPTCKASSDCASGSICVVNTCCRGGGGICVKAPNQCPNEISVVQVFKRRTWDGETVGGGLGI